jgi:hypothetical protein
MGITIYARGRLDLIGDIPCLIDDLKSVAGDHNWTYHIIDDDFETQPNAVIARRDPGPPVVKIEGSLGLKGLVLNVGSGSEPLSILFDRSGVLTDMLQQLSWLQSNGGYERFSLCKTQFGSIDAHIEIIGILDLVKKKYISDLAVTDEGAYWESRDRRILADKRVALGHYLRHTEKVIGSIERSEDDARDPDAVARRIEEALLKADEEGRLDRS